MRRLLHPGARPALLLALLLPLGAMPLQAQFGPEGAAARIRLLPRPRDPRLPTIFYIGDSTVRNGGGNGADGLWGWADETLPYFDTTRVNVVNRALGGRSSRTYLTEGIWDSTLAMVKSGDVVVMQFGHNDGGPLNDTSRARGTIKGNGQDSVAIDNLLTHRHEVVHSYGWYLRRFIADTRAHGATPIVVTPVPRNIWQDGHVVRNKADYAGWAEEVAREARVPVLDLNELVAQQYDLLGPEQVAAFFPRDHTHTDLAGAQLTARVAVGALERLPGNPVGAYLSPAGRSLAESSERAATDGAPALVSPAVGKLASAPAGLPRLQTGGGAMPLEWIDRDTGHRIVRLSRRDGRNESFYFNNNPFIPQRGDEGDLMVFHGTTSQGSQLFTVNLKTLAMRQLTDRARGAGGEIVLPRTREAIYQAGDSVFAVAVDDARTRLLYVFPASFRARVSSVNADGTMLAGVRSAPVVGEILKQHPTKGEYFDRIFQAHAPHDLFVIDLRQGPNGGEPRVIDHENTWLGHVLFSPTDPDLLMFCHEGPWHLVDRIWTIDPRGGTPPRLMHKRTVEREIAGHEFFSPDGRTIWFDLQVPRSVTFYLAGADARRGQDAPERRYRMTRDQWSIHFNQSPDQQLFAGDGGDSTQVARAHDGRWIYLFRPAGDHFEAEHLVNMQYHGYRPLEPNVHFSPDGRWVIFRSDFEVKGEPQIYAVEVARAVMTSLR